MEKYKLIDANEPNLLKEIFPYSLPPLIKFENEISEIIDGKQVVFDVRSVVDRDIHITDTVTIGETEILVIEKRPNALQSSASPSVRTGVNQRHTPRLTVILVHLHLVVVV